MARYNGRKRPRVDDDPMVDVAGGGGGGRLPMSLRVIPKVTRAKRGGGEFVQRLGWDSVCFMKAQNGTVSIVKGNSSTVASGTNLTVGDNTNTQIMWSKQFSLGEFIDYAYITAAYEQFRIASVEVEVFPGYDSADPQAVADGNLSSNQIKLGLPVLIYVVDINDSAVQEPLELGKHSACKFKRLDDSFKFRCKPRCYTSDTTNAPVLGGWLNSSATGIAHYGFKCAILPGSIGNGDAYKITMTYRVKLEGRKRKT